MSSQVKKDLAMGPQDDLAEVQVVFVQGTVGTLSPATAGVTVVPPPGYDVLLRVDMSQNMNDLSIHAGKNRAIVRALYRIGTPLTLYKIFSVNGVTPSELRITGTPPGATDINVFFGRRKAASKNQPEECS
jgi:hypothetical protein